MAYVALTTRLPARPQYIFIAISGCQNMFSFYFICRGTMNNIKHKCCHLKHRIRVSLEQSHFTAKVHFFKFPMCYFNLRLKLPLGSSLKRPKQDIVFKAKLQQFFFQHQTDQRISCPTTPFSPYSTGCKISKTPKQHAQGDQRGLLIHTRQTLGKIHSLMPHVNSGPESHISI